MMKKVLVDLNHPAHFHLFKNFLKSTDYQFIISIRDKDILKVLLDNASLKYTILSKERTGFHFLIIEFFQKLINTFILSYRHGPFDLAVGTSYSISFLSFFLKKTKSFNFNEDDDHVAPLHALLAYPGSTKIINPDCLDYKKWKKKRVLYPSYHELAYLHPNNFTPDERVLDKYGLKKGKYVILRIVSLNAHHDVGAKGISKEIKLKIIDVLQGYEIIESMEGKSGNKVEPWDMHHVLAFAKMIICDSQTMSIEAAVLGVPAIRINTFIGKSTVIDELEKKYKLTYGFFPDNEKVILETINELINNKSLEQTWQEKRKKLLEDKVDFNQWMIDYFEQQIEKNTYA